MGIYWAGPEWLERAAHAPGSACAVGGSQSFRLNLANSFMPCHKHWSYHDDIGSPRGIPLRSPFRRPATERTRDTEWLKCHRDRVAVLGPYLASRIAHSPRDYGPRDRRSRGRHGPHPSLRAACWEPTELSMGAHECVRAHHTESFNRLIMPAPTALVWWSVCSRPLVSTPFAVIDPSFINRRPSGSRRTASGGRSGSSGFRESL